MAYSNPFMNAPVSWQSNSGHFYGLYKQALNWRDADIYAESVGGYLAKVDSPTENQTIYTQIRQALSSADRAATTAADGGGAAYVWLGGSDVATEGSWLWAYDQSMLSINRPEWGSGALGHEPDNYQNQDYLALGLSNWPTGFASDQGYGNAGEWNDLAGSNRLFFVVEADSFKVIDGSGGNDTLSGFAGSDSISGLAGNDLLDSGFGFDTVYGGLGDDTIQGGYNGDQIFGEMGNDDLRGGNGLDFVVGGDGNDTIRGAKGTDTLTGGSGNDQFIFEKELDGVVNVDLVTDFVANEDVIILSSNIFGALLSQVGQRVGLSAYLTYNRDTGQLAYDADGSGSGTALAFAILGSDTHPDAIGTNFWVVA